MYDVQRAEVVVACAMAGGLHHGTTQFELYGAEQIYLLSRTTIDLKASLCEANSRCLLVQGSWQSHPPSNH